MTTSESPQRQLWTPDLFWQCNRHDCGNIVARQQAAVVDGKPVCGKCGHRSLGPARVPAADSDMAG